MKPDDVKYLIVHCSYTKPSMDIGAAEIRKWHTDPPRNWSDIGYHFVIRRNGRIERGRDTDTAGAHAIGYNTKSIGICLVGGMSEDGHPEENFTPAQYQTLGIVLDTLEHVYPKTETLGHTDLPYVDKECPCFDVGAWRADKRNSAHTTTCVILG